MKISQYNWNWWFVMNIICFITGFMFGVGGYDYAANIILIVCLVSFIPCLYIGLKPEE